MSLNLLFDAIVAFLVLGVTEVLIKPLAMAVVSRPLKRALPAVFERLDNDMPELLQKADPEVMTAHIASTIAKATGKPATANQIDQVVTLYSPIKAAIRNL
jgi:hypothetical protein